MADTRQECLWVLSLVIAVLATAGLTKWMADREMDDDKKNTYEHCSFGCYLLVLGIAVGCFIWCFYRKPSGSGSSSLSPYSYSPFEF